MAANYKTFNYKGSNENNQVFLPEFKNSHFDKLN